VFEVRALSNEEGVLDGPDEHSHVVGVGEIVCLYYHRVLNMPYIILKNVVVDFIGKVQLIHFHKNKTVK
jgi:hypothetical protein